MKLFYWIKAIRPPSQLYIITPIILGVSLSGHQIQLTNNVNYFLSDIRLYFLIGFSIFIQFYIILANDYADMDTDTINEDYTIFSGGSRVLVNKQLSRNSIFIGALFSGILAVLISVGLAMYGFVIDQNLSFSPIFAILSILLLWMYSYSPLKLSYRGNGELLQVLGLGMILPLFGFYVFRGNIYSFPWQLLLILLPTHWACAVSTSLPDYKSDSFSNKNTVTVQLGLKKTVILIHLYQAVGILSFIILTGKLLLSFFLIIIMLISILLSIPKPGTKKMTTFVFLEILITLSIQWIIVILSGIQPN